MSTTTLIWESNEKASGLRVRAELGNTGLVLTLHRRLYAVAIYLYGRAAEIQALEWRTVDLERRTIRIHQAVDRVDGGVKPTKAEEVRDLLIEANLAPLLFELCAETKGTVIARHPHRRQLARAFGDVFPALPRCLLGAASNRSAKRSASPQLSGMIATPMGIEPMLPT